MHRRSIPLLCLPFVLACDTLEAPAPTADAALAPELAAAPLAVPIVPNKELFVTATSVVKDPRYVDYRPGRFNTDEEGGFSFGRLVDNLQPVERPTDQQRSAFVMRWLLTWERPQTVNGRTLAARPAVRDLVITPWKLRSIGRLPGNTPQSCSASPATDFTCKLAFGPGVVPFELIAVVNRPDLRVLPTGTDPTTASAGQGRFVFVLVDAERNPLPFTVIFEYMVPTTSREDTQAWAAGWHRLGAIPFGPTYNRELQLLTRRFARWRAAPWRNNGSALLQLRTNDVMLAAPGTDPSNPFGGALWELREFVLGANGQLVPDTVKQEPRVDLSGTALLSDWANENAAGLLAGTATLPASYRGQPFLAPSSEARFDFVWDVPGVSDEVRDAFALGTCNGCHVNETGTTFLHVFPFEKGAEATLSPFLAAELAPGGARIADFEALLTAAPALMPPGPGLDQGNPPRPR